MSKVRISFLEEDNYLQAIYQPINFFLMNILQFLFK